MLVTFTMGGEKQSVGVRNYFCCMNNKKIIKLLPQFVCKSISGTDGPTDGKIEGKILLFFSPGER